MANTAAILNDIGLPAPEPTLGERIVTPFENFYGTIGAINPSHRFLVTALAVSAIEFVAEPSFAFTSDGRARPSSLVSDDRDATLFHWTVLPLVLGLVSALYI